MMQDFEDRQPRRSLSLGGRVAVGLVLVLSAVSFASAFWTLLR